jgi:hypothetical protein
MNICCDSISKNKTEKSKEFLKDKCVNANANANITTNIITTEPNNLHIQKMIEELKSIIANIKNAK